MKKVIYEGNHGILWKAGKIIKQLDAGRHSYSLFGHEKIEIIPILPTDYIVSTQDFSTKDNLSVRFSLSINSRVVNVMTLRKNTLPEEIHQNLIRIASGAAREFVAATTLDTLLENSSTLHTILEERISTQCKAIGIQAIVSPISIQLPRSLRQAFEAELNVRKKAAADLEEARGRTAVLRHLANAADLVEKRPVLLQLLLGQKARNVHFEFQEPKKHSDK